MINMMMRMMERAIGLWRWKPQPMSFPSSLRVMRTPARAHMETTTPRPNVIPCHLILDESSPACWAKPVIFRPRTGKTQGMMFRIRPARRAKGMTVIRVNDFSVEPSSEMAFWGVLVVSAELEVALVGVKPPSHAEVMKMLWFSPERGVEGLWRMPLIWSSFSAGSGEKSLPSLNLPEMVRAPCSEVMLIGFWASSWPLYS